MITFSEKNVQNRKHFLWAHVLTTLSLLLINLHKYTLGFLFFVFWGVFLVCFLKNWLVTDIEKKKQPSYLKNAAQFFVQWQSIRREFSSGSSLAQKHCLLCDWRRVKGTKQRSFKLEVKISTQNSKCSVEMFAALHVWFICT